MNYRNGWDFKLKTKSNFSVCIYSLYTHTHTHTHTQMLLRFFDQYGGIEGPEILREMDTKELEANLALHFSPINVDVYICFAIWKKKEIYAIIIIYRLLYICEGCTKMKTSALFHNHRLYTVLMKTVLLTFSKPTAWLLKLLLEYKKCWIDIWNW